ncbi:MAG: hypothetical protein JSR98_18565 [Proteobacteria bacterium]|nr:hypothetical protein [Pseudomonadota bacterium]
MAQDTFGFAAAADDSDPAVDLAAFAPKPKPVDRKAAAAASEVAQDAGFSRRTTKPREAKPAAAPAPASAPKGARRRISISEAIGRTEERYSDEQRAQLNLLAPLPVVLRWRELTKGENEPAWVLLERAMDALEAQGGKTRRGQG